MTSTSVREALRQIQAGLEALGHGPDPVNGRWGAQIRAAIERLLAAARLRHIAGTQWSTRKYMNMAPLRAAETEAHGAVVA